MNEQEKIQQINKSVQNTMTSAIGIEITDVGMIMFVGKCRLTIVLYSHLGCSMEELL